MLYNLITVTCGLVYFLSITMGIQKAGPDPTSRGARPSLGSLVVLIPPGIWTFLKSALRNVIYLWLISGIISMGLDYATAWGVFNIIRWGVIMVLV